MFGFATTADEVIDGVDLSGKTAVVTGASSGLGLADGGHVVLCRCESGCGGARSRRIPRLGRMGRPGELTQGIDAIPLDLASLECVPRRVRRSRRNIPRIDILINNAGVMFTPPAPPPRVSSCSSASTISGTSC